MIDDRTCYQGLEHHSKMAAIFIVLLFFRDFIVDFCKIRYNIEKLIVRIIN